MQAECAAMRPELLSKPDDLVLEDLKPDPLCRPVAAVPALRTRNAPFRRFVRRITMASNGLQVVKEGKQRE